MFMTSIEQRDAHRGPFYALSVEKAVNVVFRDEYVHINIDEINDIVESMKYKHTISDVLLNR